jgi:hypothetical protein
LYASEHEVSQTTATVSRGSESATVAVEIRPAIERRILVVDLTTPPAIHTSETVPGGFPKGCEIAARSGIRYATSLAGRDQLIAILELSGHNLGLDAQDAFAHAAMYATWKALGFQYTEHEINVDRDWELQA